MTPLHVIAGLSVLAGMNRCGGLVGYLRTSIGDGAPPITAKQRIHYYQTHYKELNDQFPASGQNGRELRATLQARQFWWAYLQEGATSQKAVDNALKIYRERKGKDPRVKTAFRTLAEIDNWILKAK